MLLDVASGGELHVALAAGVPAIVVHDARQQQERRRAAHGDRRRRAPHRRRQLRRARPPRRAPRRRRGRCPTCCCASRPGVHAHTHEYIATGQDDSKFGFNLGNGDAAAGGRAGAAVGVGRPRRAALPHRLQRVRRRQLRQGGRGDGRLRRAATTCPSSCSAAGSASPTSRARRRRRSPSGRNVAARRLRRAGCRGRRSASSRGGRSSPPAAITVYTVGTIKEIPGVRTYVAVDGGMSDNPRPVLYGSGYEAFLPRAVDADRPIARPHRRQALRVRRRLAVRRPRCPPTSPSATCSPCRSPAPTATRWAPTTTRCRARRWCSSRDGEARLVVRRETYDDLLATDVG